MTRKSVCPFWSQSSGHCNVALDGLFIPLDEHVEKFCTSVAHTFCKQYTRTSIIEPDHSITVSDRRRYDRHADSRDITIIRSVEYPEDSSLRVSATVVDFSKGGIRLLLKENLGKNANVTCSLGNELPEHLRSGHAMIRWCQPLLNQSGYQAGLSFKDDILPNALISCQNSP